jgi:hypothetical protein
MKREPPPMKAARRRGVLLRLCSGGKDVSYLHLLVENDRSGRGIISEILGPKETQVNGRERAGKGRGHEVGTAEVEEIPIGSGVRYIVEGVEGLEFANELISAVKLRTYEKIFGLAATGIVTSMLRQPRYTLFLTALLSFVPGVCPVFSICRFLFENLETKLYVWRRGRV